MKPRQALACVAAWLPLLVLPVARAATCQYVQVEKGDNCISIAETRCKITVDRLYALNGINESYCKSLQLKEALCCSRGDKPVLTPQEGEDGSCASYKIKEDDICQTIEDEFYLESGDLDKFNKGKTWGWAGCSMLVLNATICLSDGTPPMPAPIGNAVCGPQVYVSQLSHLMICAADPLLIPTWR